MTAKGSLRSLDAEVLDALSDGLVIVDAQERVRFVNMAVERLIGRSRADLIGQSVWEAFPEALGLPFFAHYSRVQSEREPAQFETYYAPQDLWLEARFSPLADGGVIANIWDVSARKRLEEVLHATFEQTAIGIAHSAPDGRLLRVNDQFCALVRRSREELLALNIRDLTAPEDGPAEDVSVQRVARGEIAASSMEKRYLRPDGSAVWGQLTLSLVRDAQGQPLYFIGAVEDISERKRLEEDLRSSEERFRATFEQAAIGLAHASLDRQLVQVNDRFCTFLGRRREDLVGHALQEFTHPEDVAAGLPHLQQLLAGERETYRSERRYFRPDGTLVWGQMTLSVVRHARGESDYLVVALEDISERKQLEEALAAQAAEWQVIFNAITDGVFVYRPDGSIREANVANQSLLLTDPDTLASRTIEERIQTFQARTPAGALLTPEEYPAARILRGEALTGNAAMDMTVLLPDGAERELNVSGAPIRDTRGTIIGGVAVARDMTERRRLEAEIAARAQQLQAIFDTITDWIWVYDAEGHIIEVNAATRRDLPEALSDYRARPIEERIRTFQARLSDGTALTRERSPIARVLRGETITGDNPIDTTVRLPDGSERELGWSGAPVRDTQGRVVGAVTVARDVTERKRLERQRIDILRIVAHDLGNPLGAMKLGLQSYDLMQQARERLYEQIEQETGHEVGQSVRQDVTGVERARIEPLIEREAQLTENIAHVMEVLHDAVERMERLVSNLNTATRLETAGGLLLQRAPFDLADACWREARMLKHFSKHKVVTEIPPEPITIEGDVDAVRRVIANLLSNADKYSPIDRPITLALTCEANSEADGSDERWARVAVIDQGPGIPEAERERVWEQFHQVPGIKAHDVAGGLGLGLAICRGIIEQLGGRIRVDSAVGAGSTFWFLLPLA